MKRWVWLAVVLAIALLALGCDNVSKEGVSPESTAHGQKAEGKEGPVLARVGDAVITVKDFQAQVERIPPFYRAQLQSKEGKQRLLDNLIRLELLYQEALRQGLDKDPEYTKRLEEIKKSLLARSLEQKISESEIEVTDKQIADYYEENKERYAIKPSAHIYQILVKVPKDASEQDEKAAQEKINKAYAELKAGKEFSEVAKEYSEDSFTAKRGGEIPKLRKGTRSEEVNRVVFEELNPGEMSAPFKDKRGWNIIKLVSRTDASYKTLDDVRDQIKRTLQFKLKRETLENKVEELKSKYGVVVYEEILFGPEQQPAEEEGEEVAPPNKGSELIEIPRKAPEAKESEGEKGTEK